MVFSRKGARRDGCAGVVDGRLLKQAAFQQRLYALVVARPAHGLLCKILQLRMRVDETGHSGRDRAFEILLQSELREAEGLGFGQRLNLGLDALLEDLRLDAVLAQHVVQRPGGHVTQRVPGAAFAVGYASHPGHHTLSLVQPADAARRGQVAQAGRKAHAVQD
jgi:hypothetical protein